MEDITPALYTLIEPLGTMSFFVDWDRKGLTTAVIYCVDERNIELLGMLR